MRVELQTMAASGDHVFVLRTGITGKRKGKTLDTMEVLVFKLDKGVVTEADQLPVRLTPQLAKFWS